MKSDYGSRLIALPGILLALSLCHGTLYASGNDDHHKIPGRCTGSAYCSVCSNCSRCGHCGAGGTCGVCAGTSAGRTFSGGGSGGSSSYRSSRSSSSYSVPRRKKSAIAKPKPAQPPRLPDVFTARVISVEAGDKLTVVTNSNRKMKFTLYGIQAPTDTQPLFSTSRQALVKLAKGKTVTVTSRGTEFLGDKLATIVQGGRNLNHEQVRQGMATHYSPGAPTDTTLETLQNLARVAKRGVWAEKGPSFGAE